MRRRPPFDISGYIKDRSDMLKTEVYGEIDYHFTHDGSLDLIQVPGHLFSGQLQTVEFTEGSTVLRRTIAIVTVVPGETSWVQLSSARGRL